MATRCVHSVLSVVLALSLGTAGRPARAADSAGPAEFFLLVFSSPVAGKEDEYNRWYDQEHAPDVVSIPGFVSAQRFVYSDVQLREVALKKPRYLALYRIVTGDLPTVIAEVKHRLATGRTRISASLDASSAQMYIYRAFRPEVPGVAGQPADAKPGRPQTYYHVVFGDAVAGRDDEFNTWYDNEHVRDIVAAPGFVFGRRAIISEVQMEPITNPSRYLAVFKIVTTDLPAVFRHKGGSEPPAAFDRARTFGYTYQAIGVPLVGDEVRATRAAATSRAHPGRN